MKSKRGLSIIVISLCILVIISLSALALEVYPNNQVSKYIIESEATSHSKSTSKVKPVFPSQVQWEEMQFHPKNKQIVLAAFNKDKVRAPKIGSGFHDTSKTCSTVRVFGGRIAGGNLQSEAYYRKCTLKEPVKFPVLNSGGIMPHQREQHLARLGIEYFDDRD